MAQRSKVLHSGGSHCWRCGFESHFWPLKSYSLKIWLCIQEPLQGVITEEEVFYSLTLTLFGRTYESMHKLAGVFEFVEEQWAQRLMWFCEKEGKQTAIFAPCMIVHQNLKSQHTSDRGPTHACRKKKNRWAEHAHSDTSLATSTVWIGPNSINPLNTPRKRYRPWVNSRFTRCAQKKLGPRQLVVLVR